jgi:hypothetical protein
MDRHATQRHAGVGSLGILSTLFGMWGIVRGKGFPCYTYILYDFFFRKRGSNTVLLLFDGDIRNNLDRAYAVKMKVDVPNDEEHTKEI